MKKLRIMQQGEKISMAQAVGLYLYSFPSYRKLNVRSRVKFLMPGGPLKICEKTDCAVRA